MRLLDREGVASGEGYTLPSRYTHAQMGDMIGARAFGQLKDEEAVQLRRRMIYIRNTDDPEHAAAREK